MVSSQSMITPAILLALVAIVLVVGQGNNNQSQLRSFKDLIESARNLESAERVIALSVDQKQDVPSRNTRMYWFLRESKAHHCNTYYDSLVRLTNEFKIKTFEYLAESKKGGNWLNAIRTMIVGPLNAMKGLARRDALFNQLPEKYESQVKNGLLKEETVNCDMLKLHVKALESIMFVLQTEIKYLATENIQILNRAITDYLKQENFASSHNFYLYEKLTPKQHELLRKIYMSRTDIETTPIEHAIAHFNHPGGLITGRILESCKEVEKYANLWRDLDVERIETCKNTSANPDSRQFEIKFKLDKYENTIEFCISFLDAL